MTPVDLDACRTRLLRSILSTKAQIEARLTVCLAGRAAEETMLGAPTTGASQDLLDATTLAMELHGTWGFGAMGLVSFSREAALHDRALRDAVRETLDVAYARRSISFGSTRARSTVSPRRLS